ncbi:flagellin [Actinoplanes octamycinicus]|uniref:Flagellin n=1 Tax=Actinoplanes octamycinicus TaxID=135948 RepID=A0A7W7GSS9_9ACTN|nr:flagellin [Actinoplanes octamycinicus]MBB4737630.1 flagellin [Actinoplanes octamycinicus]GIE57934.1 flagellin [Actinoplanes octamycinicus]
MGLRINQNIAAQNAYRNLSVTDSQMSKSLEKLSSGFRINRAADDAAGLSISEGLRAQTGGLKVAVRNAQDAISVVQTAEGALNEVTSMLQRMRDLSVQASNASLDTEAKGAAQKEFDQLAKEIDRVGETTAFGKSKLLDGSFGTTEGNTADNPLTSMPSTISFNIQKIGSKDLSDSPIAVSVTPAAGDTAKDVADKLNTAIKTALTAPANAAQGFTGNELHVSSDVKADGTGMSFSLDGTAEFDISDQVGDAFKDGSSTTKTASTNGDFQIGANAGEKLNVSIGKVSASALGLSGLDLSGPADANGDSGAAKAIKALDSAIKSVSDQRASLGASQNRFEHTINNLNTAVENLSASESRIRDTDMAQEMVSFTRSQILTQAGTSMLSQANQSSQNVLSLLR